MGDVLQGGVSVSSFPARNRWCAVDYTGPQQLWAWAGPGLRPLWLPTHCKWLIYSVVDASPRMTNFKHKHRLLCGFSLGRFEFYGGLVEFWNAVITDDKLF